MAANAQRAFPDDFMGDGPTAAMVLKVVGNFVGIWLWGLAIWFLFVSVGAHGPCMRQAKMPFAMTWYSFVFPNTALVTATFAIGKAFGSKVIQVVGCVLTVILIMVWIIVFIMMIRAIVLKQILWPQKGEDKDEGGWKVTIQSDHPQNDGFTQNKQEGSGADTV
ncbi:c4-dicarboxylate transporter malic acid transport [Lasallia pustulata]|uniref:C4-dicarboxylate transporter malic acid transport n=1 Tax=Lasallia pustulata TaxID=136370 RepID=A0A1W5CY92_9LECA|nr:c4-dicarboxylate transporter malic acid transport [Lasallia pustulata]